MGPEPEPPSGSPTPEPATEAGGQPKDPRIRDLPPEKALPRGCNPLTFGVVMATLEMALLVGLWMRCH